MKYSQPDAKKDNLEPIGSGKFKNFFKKLTLKLTPKPKYSAMLDADVVLKQNQTAEQKRKESEEFLKGFEIPQPKPQPKPKSKVSIKSSFTPNAQNVINLTPPAPKPKRKFKKKPKGPKPF